MDAVQKLICKAVGDERNYQSVLSAQRKVGMTFGPVNHDHIQLFARWQLTLVPEFLFRCQNTDLR